MTDTRHVGKYGLVTEREPLPHADRLYLDLKGARERLCRAQMAVPAHWRSDLQAALDHIDLTGSAVCPEQWSRFDQPQEATDGR